MKEMMIDRILEHFSDKQPIRQQTDNIMSFCEGIYKFIGPEGNKKLISENIPDQIHDRFKPVIK